MAISEFEIKRCERELTKFLTEHRPPEHLRSQIDIHYRISGASVEIFEIRPDIRDQNIKVEAPFAKASYDKTQSHWQIYWQKADLKWHTYEPQPTVKLFEDFLTIVSQDKHYCFFG